MKVRANRSVKHVDEEGLIVDRYLLPIAVLDFAMKQLAGLGWNESAALGAVREKGLGSFD